MAGSENEIITVEILHTKEGFYSHHEFYNHEFYNFRVVPKVKLAGETTRLNFYNAKFRNQCGNTDLENLDIADVVKQFLKSKEGCE